MIGVYCRLTHASRKPTLWRTFNTLEDAEAAILPYVTDYIFVIRKESGDFPGFPSILPELD